MRKLFLAIALTLGVAGCGTIETVRQAYQAVVQVKVSPTAIIVAANTFNAMEATATNYLRLPRCTGTNGPVCRSPVATAKLIPAIRSGRVARDNAIDFIEKHPGELGPQGLYDALKTSVETLRIIFSQYNVGG